MDFDPSLDAVPVRCLACGDLVEVELSFESLRQNWECPSCGGRWLLRVERDEWGDPAVTIGERA